MRQTYFDRGKVEVRLSQKECCFRKFNLKRGLDQQSFKIFLKTMLTSVLAKNQSIELVL